MYQSGFRPHHSTETALIKVINKIILASNQGCVFMLVLIDFSAALDAIHHTNLIDRLKYFYDHYQFISPCICYFLVQLIINIVLASTLMLMTQCYMFQQSQIRWTSLIRLRKV